jgi:hypothetical protein
MSALHVHAHTECSWLHVDVCTCVRDCRTWISRTWINDGHSTQRCNETHRDNTVLSNVSSWPFDNLPMNKSLPLKRRCCKRRSSLEYEPSGALMCLIQTHERVEVRKKRPIFAVRLCMRTTAVMCRSPEFLDTQRGKSAWAFASSTL